MKNVKERVYELIDVTPHKDENGKRIDIIDLALIVLIVLNVLAVILDTVQGVHKYFESFFFYFETFSVIVFTIEYVVRIWACTIDPKFRKPITGRIRYILTPLAIIDLLAIIPFYLPILIPFDLRFLRAIRLIRIVRLFKLSRYTESLAQFGRVLKAKRAALITTVFIILILLIVASSLLYYVEHGAQPEKFSSIPEAMWWGVATLTTVGYGDIYPITGLGKFLGAIISLLGIGLFALPTGLISAGLMEEIVKKRKREVKCPVCGAIIGDYQGEPHS